MADALKEMKMIVFHAARKVCVALDMLCYYM
jgi:hypothetical protein